MMVITVTTERCFPQKSSPREMHYLLHPLDIDVRLRVNRDPFDLTAPRVLVKCRINDFALELERSQYQALLFLSSAFESQSRQARYRRFRPRNSSVTDDPKSWWLYAYNAVVLDIRDHRSRGVLSISIHDGKTGSSTCFCGNANALARRCGVRMIVAMVCTESSVGTIRADLSDWSIGLT